MHALGNIGLFLFLRDMKIRDKEFKVFISYQEIIHRTEELGAAITKDYKDKTPLFLGVLNGSFMFAADLMKAINIPCEISFVKFSSYENLESTGQVKELVGLKENLKGRHVIILEDIVDSGRTIAHIFELLRQYQVASFSVATLLFKPEALTQAVSLKYIGFSIPSTFVVGYGLDYNGYGRNLKDLYQLDETK